MSFNVMYNKGKRDPRLITVRRGGILQDADHRLLAVWTADCAEHVLHLFEEMHPTDLRPREAIQQAHAWSRGEINMAQARKAAFAAHGRARTRCGCVCHSGRSSSGQLKQAKGGRAKPVSTGAVY